jgi:hypothetical protein
MPIESLFPQGGGGIKLAASSGWSRVMGIDAGWRLAILRFRE